MLKIIKNILGLKSSIKDILELYHVKLKYDIKETWIIDRFLRDNNLGIQKQKISDKEVIISLTTYGERYKYVYITIESLMQQTLKANRIILWLDYSYKGKTILPVLKKQMDRGLEIRYCKDLGSYKKLIPCLKEFPDSIIITVDDDVIYNARTIEKLVYAYNNNPNFIYCNRMHRIKYNGKLILPYNEWEKGVKDTKESVFNFPVGVGGVLYPPKCFNDEIFNDEFFLSQCPNGDDIWFKAMSLINNYPSIKAEESIEQDDYFENYTLSPRGLQKENVFENLNDIKIANVYNKYNKEISSKFIHY